MNFQEFYEKAKEDIELQQAYKEAADHGKLMAFLAEHGIDCTVEQLNEYLAQHAGNLLNDDVLSGVAGGSWGMRGTCESGECKSPDEVVFLFNVGDVREKSSAFYGTMRVTITGRRAGTRNGYYVPMYRWKADDGIRDGEDPQDNFEI